jgi:hypothetical protein
MSIDENARDELVRRILYVAVKRNFDREWMKFAETFKMELNVIKALVLVTFRFRVKNAVVSDQNRKTLEWLVDLYGGMLPNDVQLSRMPFKTTLVPGVVQVEALANHLESMCETFSQLPALVRCGMLVLMSSSEAKSILEPKSEVGVFILRVSNGQPNSLAISGLKKTGIGHVVLDHISEKSEIEAVGAEVYEKEIGGQTFKFVAWTDDLVRKCLAKSSYNCQRNPMSDRGFDTVNEFYGGSVRREFLDQADEYFNGYPPLEPNLFVPKQLEEHDWIVHIDVYCKADGIHECFEEIVRRVLFIGAQKRFLKSWVEFALQYRTKVDLIKALVLVTFRFRTMNADISYENRKALEWLVDLYAGLLPNDTQLRRMPFPPTLVSGEVHVEALANHLETMCETLSKLYSLVRCGLVMMVSALEAEKVLRTLPEGTFILRVSHNQPNNLGVAVYLGNAIGVKNLIFEYPQTSDRFKISLDNVVMYDMQIGEKTFRFIDWTPDLVKSYLSQVLTQLGFSCDLNDRGFVDETYPLAVKQEFLEQA